MTVALVNLIALDTARETELHFAQAVCRGLFAAAQVNPSIHLVFVIPQTFTRRFRPWLGTADEILTVSIDPDRTLPPMIFNINAEAIIHPLGSAHPFEHASAYAETIQVICRAADQSNEDAASSHMPEANPRMRYLSFPPPHDDMDKITPVYTEKMAALLSPIASGSLPSALPMVALREALALYRETLELRLALETNPYPPRISPQEVDIAVHIQYLRQLADEPAASIWRRIPIIGAAFIGARRLRNIGRYWRSSNALALELTRLQAVLSEKIDAINSRNPTDSQ